MMVMMVMMVIIKLLASHYSIQVEFTVVVAIVGTVK